MVDSVFWFSFVMGLLGFAGFVLLGRNAVRATPDSIGKLQEDIKELKEILRDDFKDLSGAVGEHFEEVEGFRKTSLSSLLEIKQMVESLKQMHETPDNFNFGTKETNELLKDISNRLIVIETRLQ